MTLQLDHVFVCTAAGAPEASALIAAGLQEGSPNTHPGQGTANRRFFFATGFLELLYVHDPGEARSELSAPIRLWERWSQRGATTNPFGICLSAWEASKDFPLATRSYQPSYLPPGRCIRFVDGLALSEPEVFVLDWQPAPRAEPSQDRLGLRQLQSVSVGLRDPSMATDALRALSHMGALTLHESTRPELRMYCAADRPTHLSFPQLGLQILGG